MTEELPNNELARRRNLAFAMGGAERMAKVHAAGKLSARERIAVLLDPGSFEETGVLAHSQFAGFRDRTPADGVVTGSGKVDGRRIFVMADDPSVLAGTRGRVAEEKLFRIKELALRERHPIVMLNEAGAARVQESNGAYAAGLGRVFEQHFQLSGVVPQVSLHMGACFGGPSFVGAMGDATFMVKGTGFMGMSGPPLVKVGIGVDLSPEEIGGVDMATRQTGQVDYLAEDEVSALKAVRRYLSYFPSNCDEKPPSAESRICPGDTPEGREQLARIVPDNHRRSYSVLSLIGLLADEDSVFVLGAEYGKSLATALARINGESVGVVASNPGHRAGVMDEKTAIKARKFVDLCDAFHIPLIFLCDTPGFLVGPEIERQRMVSHCARLLTSVMTASVPKITVVTRKAIGMAYIVMCGRACRPNLIVAWPGALFDVMGPEAGVMLAFEREIKSAADPEARKKEYLAQFESAASCYEAAGLALIDDVISPGETRQVIINALARARDCDRKGFKHFVSP